MKKLQEFFGMETYYHRFLPKIATTLTPLYEALKNTPKSLTWSSDTETKFIKAKQAMADATLLSYPSSRATLIITTGASDAVVGELLEQMTRSGPQPLGFFNKKKFQ